MGRFADTGARTRVELGACDCPGTPHSSDWVDVRSQLSWSEITAFAATGGADEIAERVAGLIVEWNILNEDGEDWPPSAGAVLALKAETLNPIVEEVNRSVEASAKGTSSPNASSARSRTTTRASASRTRPTPPKR